MSRDILSGVVFNPGAKTLDFTNVIGFDKRRLLTAVHGPSNSSIFLLGGGRAVGGTWSANGLVLTLAADTTGMGANDPLTITLDDEPTRFFQDAINVSVAATGQFTGTLRDLGDNSPYGTFNAAVFINKAGRLQIYQSLDAAGGAQIVTDTAEITGAGGGFARLSVPVCARYVRAVVTNSDASAAASVTLTSALTA